MKIKEYIGVIGAFMVAFGSIGSYFFDPVFILLVIVGCIVMFIDLLAN